MPYNALEFFAGAGGLSEGLRLAGINVKFANEIDCWAQRTYELNHPDTYFECGDITDLTTAHIEACLQEHFEMTFQDIDIMVGGPPCQGFSIIGQRNIDDPRNRLFREFLRLVTEVQPSAFIMENVFGLLSMQDGRVKDEIIEAFTEAGYHVSDPRVLTAADFGVPQLRRRVFFLGIRIDLSDVPLTYPLPTHSIGDNNLPRYVTVGDAIGDLPRQVIESEGFEVGDAMQYAMIPQTDYQRQMRIGSAELYNHHTKKFLDTRMQRISFLEEGATKVSLPPQMQAGGHENKYRRLSSREPSPTLTAHMSKDLSDFVHPRFDRPITVREAARIQSFGDNYHFTGSEFQQLKQIGNAVPPLLGFAVANHVARQLDEILGRRDNG